MNMEGVMLKDEELEMVSGGVTNTSVNGAAGETPLTTKKFNCPKCGVERDFYLYSGGRCVCSKCAYEMFK